MATRRLHGRHTWLSRGEATRTTMCSPAHACPSSVPLASSCAAGVSSGARCLCGLIGALRSSARACGCTICASTSASPKRPASRTASARSSQAAGSACPSSTGRGDPWSTSRHGCRKCTSSRASHAPRCCCGRGETASGGTRSGDPQRGHCPACAAARSAQEEAPPARSRCSPLVGCVLCARSRATKKQDAHLRASGAGESAIGRPSLEPHAGATRILAGWPI